MNRHACLNRLYRLIWSHARQAWVVAPENSRGQGKSTIRRGLRRTLLSAAGPLLVAAPMLAIPAWAWAELPTRGSISAGQGSISGHGNHLVVNQNSDKLALNWQSFSIGKDNTVTFKQPSASAIALNRVLGADVSSIQGSLVANGQVFLLNPNGILFSQTAQVNVGGLVASTLKLSDEDFLNGNYRFEGDSEAAIIQRGSITSAEGGSVVLIAGQILNYGDITAEKGQVLFASGSKVLLDLGSEVALEIEAGAMNGLIEQGGMIVANGGRVYLTAKAASQLTTSVINHTGITQAQALASGENGEIVLLGDMNVGSTLVDGTLDASAPIAGHGGFIETSAAHVQVTDSAQLTTLSATGDNGTWLIDPVDFTVAASGGDMTGSAVTSALASSNFIIESTSGGSTGDGDININDSITWSSNTLTLNAQNDIFINSELFGSGTAGLALQYGQSAVAAGNSANYYINSAVNLASSGSFSTQLGGDGSVMDYTIITSLGSEGSQSAADLQGMNGDLAGHYVLGANIDAAATSGWHSGAGFNPIGTNATAAFTGNLDGLGHTIHNLTIYRPGSGGVGLFGYASGARLHHIGLSNTDVTGKHLTGSLVGSAQTGTTISSSYATGAVTGTESVGGLVGIAYDSRISNSYATGAVTGTEYVGGLVGYAYGSTMSNSYATGAVTGTDSVGGLVGYADDNTMSNSYWDTSTSGTTTGVGSGASAGVTGLTTAQMMQLSSFSGWDMDDAGGTGAVWRIYEGYSYPLLRTFLKALTVTTSDDSKVYDGSSYSGGNGVIFSETGATLAGAVIYSGNSQGAVNAGGYALSASGYYSDQQGYDINFVDGVLTITPASLTVTANADSKTYDGVAYAGGNGVNYQGFVGSEDASVLSGTLSYSGNAQGATNAGGYTITPEGLSSGNYTLSFVDGNLTITPAALTVTANTDSKTYDANAYAGGNGVSYDGLAESDDASDLDGSVVYSGSSQGATNSGVYTLNVGGLSSDNYIISFVDGNLTITPAPLTISANDDRKAVDLIPYSGGNGVVYTGFVAGEDESNLIGSLRYAGAAQGAVDEGSYSITPEGLSSGNYTLSFVDGVLTIGPATDPTRGNAPLLGSTSSAPSQPTGVSGVSLGAPGQVANMSAPAAGGSEDGDDNESMFSLSEQVASNASVSGDETLLIFGSGVRLPD